MGLPLGVSNMGHYWLARSASIVPSSISCIVGLRQLFNEVLAALLTRPDLLCLKHSALQHAALAAARASVRMGREGLDSTVLIPALLTFLTRLRFKKFILPTILSKNQPHHQRTG